MSFSVAQIISTGGFYGAERVVVELSQFLVNQGVDCHILALDSPGAAKLRAEAETRALKATIIPCRGAWDMRSVTELRRYVHRQGVHLVHSHGYKSDCWIRLARFSDDVRQVATCHSWFSTSLKLKLFEIIDKICLRGFHRVVGVSPQLISAIKDAGVAQEKVTLVENGLAPLPALSAPARQAVRDAWGVPAATPLIIRVSRLDRIKGNHLLLEALSRLSPRQDFRLLLVGGGEEMPALKAQAATLQLSQRVIFAGYRDDVSNLLAASDLFVIPSLQEGLPMVLLEAMAAGVPVVTTDVGAINLVIAPRRNGWLIPPDDITALRQALDEALTEPERARAYAAQAYQDYAANHSQEAMGRKYLELYRSLLGGAVHG